MIGESAPSSSPAASTEDPEIERLARERRLVRGLRVAARRAVVLARRYRHEEGPRGEREAACVKQALAWRTAARDLRAGTTLSEGPGLARTTAPVTDASRRTG